ncbi:MAG: hypothetical protein HY203_11265 [Nitrospirae bacterium]|nr:hypothetical protein [Nitrospirota bacterium]
MTMQYRQMLRGPHFPLWVLIAGLVLLTGPGLRGLSWASAAEGALHIAAQADRLSVKTSDAPLDKVLEEIARQTGVRVYGESRITPKRITAEFDDLTIQAALERILNGYNYAFVFSGNQGGDPFSRPRLTEVWLFSRGETMASGPKGAEKVSEGVHMSGEGGNSPDPSIRPQVAESMSESHDQTIIPALLNLLQDPDSLVQALAQEMLERLQGESDMLAGDVPGIVEFPAVMDEQEERK